MLLLISFSAATRFHTIKRAAKSIFLKKKNITLWLFQIFEAKCRIKWRKKNWHHCEMFAGKSFFWHKLKACSIIKEAVGKNKLCAACLPFCIEGERRKKNPQHLATWQEWLMWCSSWIGWRWFWLTASLRAALRPSLGRVRLDAVVTSVPAHLSPPPLTRPPFI